ncbi:MAG: hypothetical protein AAF598_13740 [Bacteroidota bacterium]
MKKLQFLVVILALAFAGCSEDDTVACTQADWVGTYSGTVNCDGTTEDVTVTITANGADQIVVVYETATVLTEFDPLPFTECELNVSENDGTNSLVVDADIDGDQLSFIEIIGLGSATSTCTLTATRD